MTHTKEQCCEDVHDSFGAGFHRCVFDGKHEHEGKRYCGIHYPPNVEKREQKSSARVAAEMAADSEKWARRSFDSKAGNACRTLGIKNPAAIQELVEFVRSIGSDDSAYVNTGIGVRARRILENLESKSV